MRCVYGIWPEQSGHAEEDGASCTSSSWEDQCWERGNVPPSRCNIALTVGTRILPPTLGGSAFSLSSPRMAGCERQDQAPIQKA